MKKISKVIVAAIIGIILIATFKFLWDSSRPEKAVYDLVLPQIGDIRNTTTATGNMEPRNEISVKPEISGIIKSILKKTGQRVHEGDIIATLRIITEAGQLNAAESRLRVTRITLEQVTEEYKRQKMLFENDVISKNEYEMIEANYRKALEEKANAEHALEIVKKGSSENSNSVNNTQIRARSSGIILDVPVKEGTSVIPTNALNDGTTIAVVADMDDLIFRGTVDETEVGKIEEGMPVSISIGAFDDETIDAELEYIAPKGKKESGTVSYEIKAAVKNPKQAYIRSNYSANANIIINQVKDVIIIPENLVEFKDGLAYVYVCNKEKKEQTFTKTQIEIGASDGVNLEVKSGLNLTDRIRGKKIAP